MTSTEKGFATIAIHAGQDSDQWNHGSVIPPLVMSTTFSLQDSPTPPRKYIYGRSGNPTRNVLETCLAALENGKHAFCFSSGLGALTAITGLLEAGNHLIVGHELYGGSTSNIKKCTSKQGMQHTFVDMTDVKNVIDAIQPNTKMVWLETPTNPTLKLTNIKAVAESLKSRPDIILVVDNTFLTCYFQKPLDLGADIVMYSLTKYMNGHSDVIMGAAITRRDDLAQKLRFNQTVMGIVPSPFDCALVNRGLKTLELRMQKHMKNALAVAKFLDSHCNVEKIIHPLFSSHPQHQLALTQQTGHSGMVCFYLKGDPKRFLQALKLFIFSGSLGGCESQAESPSLLSHESVPVDVRTKLGITDQLIRLSVGLESEDDLIADLKQALDNC
ncbi:PREDICTED: putative cystathionine gamma-lyase 2 [Cyphomyrmex costatus]|uniref:cystathionine gamma-lyase n=1 Tax=Cyphomyrmex costatus TaxID=456900 RepID=A0A195BYY7_9HYME|nr:PREDICTED: putative cystathionine gamma-lyase 2 [Cyphomyrmex costatus]KYM93827.1 Cystathionine gamma-lyase [Cyphomyrmex costatus]